MNKQQLESFKLFGFYIVEIKKGKNKGKLETRYPQYSLPSKYRKKKPNKFKKQNRFLTQMDMAEAKRIEAIYNSKVKRGENERGKKGYHYVCGCGVEGCIGYAETHFTKSK